MSDLDWKAILRHLHTSMTVDMEIIHKVEAMLTPDQLKHVGDLLKNFLTVRLEERLQIIEHYLGEGPEVH